MKWILIAYLCHSTGAFSSECSLKEVATFNTKQDCMEAAEKYKYSSPVCGVKP